MREEGGAMDSKRRKEEGKFLNLSQDTDEAKGDKDHESDSESNSDFDPKELQGRVEDMREPDLDFGEEDIEKEPWDGLGTSQKNIGACEESREQGERDRNQNQQDRPQH